MKVFLSAALFGDSPENLKLNNLASMAMEGRHRLFVMPPTSAAFRTWIDAQEKGLREEWTFALDASIALEPLTPATIEIEVHRLPTSDFLRPRPHLTIDDALRLLSAPFRILVENSRNDAAFIERMASASQREELIDRRKRGYLKFEQGGGISEIAQLLKTEDYSGQDCRMKTFVITDSDALFPDEPSDQAAIVHKLCANLKIESHQLIRRNIENYLPLAAIYAWAGRDARRKEKAEAFKALNPRQRAHFNMKRGFRQDRANEHQTSKDLYADVTARILAKLETGFGSNLAQCYSAEGMVKDEHIDREGVRRELGPVVSRIIEMLR